MESAVYPHALQSYALYGSSHRNKEPRIIHDALYRLNCRMDHLGLPHDVNEPCVQQLLDRFEAAENSEHTCYWLIVARVFELALVCAGHYADHCEFRMAGDLLVNPRKVLIYRNGFSMPLLKRRHGRISEQVDGGAADRKELVLKIKREVCVEVAEPAILPYLFELMRDSRKVAQWYLDQARARMNKVSDTIGFLSAWQVSRSEDLYQRRLASSPQARRFIDEHLCRFETHYFVRLGREIRRLMECGDRPCEFLAQG